MRNSSPADELINRCFRLAYFILGDRPASIYVAMAAMDKLKTAIAGQVRRQYYVPTGRATYPPSRTKVNFSKLHLLQRLVYVESELFERLLEGQRKTVQQDDLIIRYIKHLVRITTKHNSFYVTLGLCRLLYNYSTAETSEIYNLVLQNPDRIRDDYYYRARKKHLIREIKDRFGDLLRTQRGFRMEERFLAQEDSEQYVAFVNECLIRFAPWDSACVLPRVIAPNHTVIAPLSFAGGNPDKEHQVELNRIHSIIHPHCLERLTVAVRLDPPSKRLELPAFSVSGSGPRPLADRLNPSALTEEELDAIRRYLNKNAIQRKRFFEGGLRVVVDGVKRPEFVLNDSASRRFQLDSGSELIEIRSVGTIETDGDTPLAVLPVAYDKSGVLPSELSARLGRRGRLLLALEPSSDDSGESHGATLRVSCESSGSASAFSGLQKQAQSWFGRLDELGQPVGGGRVGRRILVPALGVILIALVLTNLLSYLLIKPKPSSDAEMARVQTPEAESTPSSPASSEPDQLRINQATTGEERGAANNNSNAKRVGSSDKTKDVERTRGTARKLSAATLGAVKRIYVDPLGDDEFNRQLREELENTLRLSNQFDVVNDRSAADAVFKGSVAQAREGSVVSLTLELVNARGQVVWSLSRQQSSRTLSGDAAEISRKIVALLLRDVKRRRPAG